MKFMPWKVIVCIFASTSLLLQDSSQKSNLQRGNLWAEPGRQSNERSQESKNVFTRQSKQGGKDVFQASSSKRHISGISTEKRLDKIFKKKKEREGSLARLRSGERSVKGKSKDTAKKNTSNLSFSANLQRNKKYKVPAIFKTVGKLYSFPFKSKMLTARPNDAEGTMETSKTLTSRFRVSRKDRIDEPSAEKRSMFRQHQASSNMSGKTDLVISTRKRRELSKEEDLKVPLEQRRSIFRQVQAAGKTSSHTLGVTTGMVTDSVQVISTRQRRDLSRRNNNCEPSLSCKDKCQDPKHFLREGKLVCFCDKECVHFQDCCADYESNCLVNVSAASNLTHVMPTSRNLSNPMKVSPTQYRSYNWLNGKNAVKGTKGLWMVGLCKPKSRASDNCKFYADPNLVLTRFNLFNAMPVYSRDGTIYRNRFCAECNEIPTSTLSPYRFSFACEIQPAAHLSDEEKLDFLLRYCGKGAGWILDRSIPRRYWLDQAVSCPPPAPQEDQLKCHKGNAAVVYSEKQNYKNIYCLKCNSFSWPRNFDCGPNYIQNQGIGPSDLPPPFSFVFNFGTNKQKRNMEQSKINCPYTKVYDPHLETCRTSNQIFAPRTSTLDKYLVLMWLRPVRSILSLTRTSAQDALALVFHSHFALLSNIDLQMVARGYKLYFNVQINWMGQIVAERKPSVGQIGAERKPSDFLPTIKDILEFNSPFKFRINGTVFTVYKATKRILSCANLKTYERYEYELLSKPKSAVFLNASNDIILANNYYKNSTSDGKQSGTIFVCHKRLTINCTGTYIPINSSEFTLFPNGSILVKYPRKVYDASEYIYENSTLWICRNLSSVKPIIKNTQKNIKREDGVLRVLTFACMLLSIVALAFFLVTYSIFSELRTPPGINLMNLSTSIVLGQILWIAGAGQTSRPLLCTTVAALLHLFLLASFMWTSIIAFDTWRTFSGKGHRLISISKRKRFLHSLRYMAVGWLPAMAFVGGCIALDQSGIVSIRYGSKMACWISNEMATVYVFAIPIGLVLVINCVFYSLTVRAIKATANQARMAAENSQTRRNFGIYVRIAAVMGFTWIFGFGAALLWQPLVYAFVILNCLQGVYITMAFALNERARRLYKGLFGIKRTPLRKAESIESSRMSQSQYISTEESTGQHNAAIEDTSL